MKDSNPLPRPKWLEDQLKNMPPTKKPWCPRCDKPTFVTGSFPDAGGKTIQGHYFPYYEWSCWSCGAQWVDTYQIDEGL